MPFFNSSPLSRSTPHLACADQKSNQLASFYGLWYRTTCNAPHLWNMFWQKPFSHGNNNIWFEARRVANIILRISLFSTTNDKPHQIDSFFGGAWHFLTTQIGTFFMIGILIPNSFRIFTAFCIIQPEVWLLLMVQPPVFSRILFYAGGANH